jgi:hypothetical protein
LVLGILHGVQGEFSNDTLGAAVGPVFTSHESERQIKPEINIHSTVKV